MAIYVTDTHPLIWYSSGAYRKLSPKARRLFDRARYAEVLIRVPAMAVWETGLLEKELLVEVARRAVWSHDPLELFYLDFERNHVQQIESAEHKTRRVLALRPVALSGIPTR